MQTKNVRHALVAATALAVLAAPAAAHAITQEETDKLVKALDDRQHQSGDFASLVYIERSERNKNDTLYEARIYRRTTDQKLVILFQKPKEEAGKGYLRVDKNLFLYDPTVGKWERRTERERIAGTDSRRNDFDESRLAIEYTARWVGEEKIGNFPVDHVKLTAKEGIDVAYPILEIWFEKGTGNPLKQQDFALSEKLMRTSYYPKWKKMFSPSKGGDVYFPGEIRIFDEIEKGNHTTIVMRDVSLEKLEDSIFTKAWLEARSR